MKSATTVSSTQVFVELIEAAAKDTNSKDPVFCLLRATKAPLWIHAKWSYGCYAAYAEYYFETWITSTQDTGGPRVAVDQLTLNWRHGSTRGSETVNNVDMVAKSDRVYSYGFGCDFELCVHGLARHQGAIGGVTAPEACSL